MTRTFDDTMPFVPYDKYLSTWFNVDWQFVIKLNLPSFTAFQYFYPAILIVPVPIKLLNIDIAIKLSNNVMFAILVDAGF